MSLPNTVLGMVTAMMPAGETNERHVYNSLFRSGHDFDLMPNFQYDVLRLNYKPFDVSRQEENDAAKMNAAPFLSQFFYRKLFFINIKN